MTLLDAYALIAYLVGGPAQAQVKAIMREGDAAVPTANLIEVLDVSQRIFRIPIERTTEALEPLFQTVIEAIELDVIVARRAATIRARRYHRTSRPISLADAVLLASAARDDRIATADPSVIAVAEAEKISTLALPQQG